MANYNKSVNFAVKDTLQSGDPNKIVSGAEIDTEFNNISSSSTTKIDKVSAAQTNNIAVFNATGALQDSGKNINEVVPTGIITMWSGVIASIPTGWALCDGSNGTPDLRNRFVVGAGDQYDRNDTGGANSVTLTESEMPSHNHSMDSAGSHSHSISVDTTSLTGSFQHRSDTNTPQSRGEIGVFTGQSANNPSGSAHSGGSSTARRVNFDGTHSHSASANSAGNHTHTINNTGGDQAHENRPPYFALAYIMKL